MFETWWYEYKGWPWLIEDFFFFVEIHLVYIVKWKVNLKWNHVWCHSGTVHFGTRGPPLFHMFSSKFISWLFLFHKLYSTHDTTGLDSLFFLPVCPKASTPARAWCITTTYFTGVCNIRYTLSMLFWSCFFGLKLWYNHTHSLKNNSE